MDVSQLAADLGLTVEVVQRMPLGGAGGGVISSLEVVYYDGTRWLFSTQSDVMSALKLLKEYHGAPDNVIETVGTSEYQGAKIIVDPEPRRKRAQIVETHDEKPTQDWVDEETPEAAEAPAAIVTPQPVAGGPVRSSFADRQNMRETSTAIRPSGARAKSGEARPPVIAGGRTLV